jgi:hypothetical protein
MGPGEWDGVPQPIRAMAFMNMLARWEDCQGLAARFGLERVDVVTRLRAIGMTESWFQHRASNRNADGTSDLGLAQATTATRAILRAREAAGLADFLYEDEDYFDPLKASRVLAYWFGLMLDETGGDLDLATAAYNVGSGRAHGGHGTEYLAAVVRIEEKFMGTRTQSPSWSWLRARSPRPRVSAPNGPGGCLLTAVP